MQKYQKSTNQNSTSPSSSKLISKDLKKLVFNFNNDDEDENEDQSLNNQELDNNNGDKRLSSSLTKLERYRNVKGVTDAKIMPSIMSLSPCLDNNYVWETKTSPKFSETHHSTTNNDLVQQNDSKILLSSNRNENNKKTKLKTRKTLAQFKIYDADDDSQPQVQKQSGQKQQKLMKQKINGPQKYRSQVKTERHNKNIKQKQQQKQIQFTNPQEKFQIKKDKIKLKKETNKIQLFRQQNMENLEEEVNYRQTSNLLFNFDSDEQRHQNNNNQNNNTQSPQILSSLPTCADQQPDYHPCPQMLNQLPKTKQLSNQLSQKISKSQSVHNIKAFLMSPVPQQIVLTFQIHKYKNFMKTQYHFQLVHPNNGQNEPGTEMMTLFAVALNDKIYIEKSLFNLSVFVKDRVITEERREEIFLGVLVSDFKRENYTMYDHKNIQKPNEVTDKVICTVSTVTNHLHPKLPTQQLYTPAPCSSHSQTLLPNNSITKNLKKMYKIAQLKQSITRYTTHAVPEQILDQMREEHKVARNTTKHALIKNGDGKIKVVFLKVSNNRFRVRIGGGLTPMQVFCYGIVHLQ